MSNKILKFLQMIAIVGLSGCTNKFAVVTKYDPVARCSVTKCEKNTYEFNKTFMAKLKGSPSGMPREMDLGIVAFKGRLDKNTLLPKKSFDYYARLKMVPVDMVVSHYFLTLDFLILHAKGKIIPKNLFRLHLAKPMSLMINQQEYKEKPIYGKIFSQHYYNQDSGGYMHTEVTQQVWLPISLDALKAINNLEDEDYFNIVLTTKQNNKVTLILEKTNIDQFKQCIAHMQEKGLGK